MRSAIPKYLTVKHVLQERLTRESSSGGRLPTEAELCAEFSVSRITVQQALNELERDGVIRREQGRGSFYLGPKPGKPEKRSVTLLETLLQPESGSKIKVIEKSIQAPPPRVAEGLGLGPGTHTVVLKRVGYSEGEPIVFIYSYLLHEIGMQIYDTESSLEHMTIAELLHRKHGVVFGSATQRISATLADPIYASHLGVQVGDPILEGERYYYRKGGQAVFCSVSYYRADRHSFEVQFKGAGLRFTSSPQRSTRNAARSN
jgi:GntR family transcriptional regulator